MNLLNYFSCEYMGLEEKFISELQPGSRYWRSFFLPFCNFHVGKTSRKSELVYCREILHSGGDVKVKYSNIQASKT